ncbi:circadian clock KaiB family protein [Desulfobacter vibrioformis]|uniref:circadian clock KaiB family protein n=1 Tax=Desulfobacter vibrioformis TaxID=34031 RepID=UPI0005530551|nr:circadian clock KaiB family protein [Desulfobacter vibrioformis]
MKKDYLFRLYTLGKVEKSALAVANLNRICEKYLKNRYQIDVIDLENNTQMAEDSGIWATPMVERRQPAPIVRVVGDLSNEDTVLYGLGIKNINV